MKIRLVPVLDFLLDTLGIYLSRLNLYPSGKIRPSCQWQSGRSRIFEKGWQVSIERLRSMPRPMFEDREEWSVGAPPQKFLNFYL